MRKGNVLIVGLLLLGIATLFAQPKHGGGKGHDRGGKSYFKLIEHYKEELNLTTEQEEALSTIEADTKAKVEAFKTQDFETFEARKEAVKAIFSATKKSVETVLTTEQKALLEAKKAAHKAEREAHHQNRKALRAALKMHHDDNILPVLSEERAKLEAKLSEEDKATIAEIRAAREAHKAKRDSLASCEGKIRGKHRHHKMGDKGARGEHKETLKALVSKYETEIDELFAAIATQKEQWEAEKQAIIEQYKPEHAGEGREGKRGCKGEKGEARHEMRKKAHFLLLEPSVAAAPRSTIDVPAMSSEFNIFPNPTRGINTIQYELETEGKVTIQLIDNQGKLVSTIEDTVKSVGSHSTEVNTSNLAEGIYHIRLQTASGVQTRQLMVNK